MGDVDHEIGADVYQNLKRLAAYYMKMERCGHTLQPTALVHEAYLRVYGSPMPEHVTQTQVIAMLARAMRRVLVDYARRHRAAKRCIPAMAPEIGLLSQVDDSYHVAADVLTIDQALSELMEVKERGVQVVELRYFAGMTEEETARVLGVSRETVKLDWRFARAWLKHRLQNGAEYKSSPCS